MSKIDERIKRALRTGLKLGSLKDPRCLYNEDINKGKYDAELADTWQAEGEMEYEKEEKEKPDPARPHSEDDKRWQSLKERLEMLKDTHMLLIKWVDREDKSGNPYHITEHPEITEEVLWLVEQYRKLREDQTGEGSGSGLAEACFYAVSTLFDPHRDYLLVEKIRNAIREAANLPKFGG